MSYLHEIQNIASSWHSWWILNISRPIYHSRIQLKDKGQGVLDKVPDVQSWWYLEHCFFMTFMMDLEHLKTFRRSWFLSRRSQFLSRTCQLPLRRSSFLSRTSPISSRRSSFFFKEKFSFFQEKVNWFQGDILFSQGEVHFFQIQLSIFRLTMLTPV